MNTPGRLVLGLISATLLLQRLVIPLGASGQLPLSLPITLVILVVGLRRRLVRTDRRGTVTYAILAGAAILGTMAALATGRGWSPTSLGLLVVIYLVMLVRPSDDMCLEIDWLLDRFTDLMQVAGVIGLLQAVLQYVGVPYMDVLARVVPEQFLITGFNTGNPITVGSAIIRVNAVLFLEPSVLSLLLGLAAVIAVSRNRNTGVVALLLLAILPTVAITGLLVVVIGLGQLALLRRWSPAGKLFGALFLAGAAGAVVPGALRFITRISELGEPNTSGSGRTIAPYAVLLPNWSRDMHALLTGMGSGSATDRIAASGIDGLLATVIPKVLYEYGAIAGAMIVAALLAHLWTGMLQTPWGVSLVVVFFGVNASLLQPTLVIITFVFVAFLGPAAGRTRAGTRLAISRREGDPQRVEV